MIPIRTSITPRKTPYVNYWLIGINIVIFALTYIGKQQRLVGGQVVVETLRPVAVMFQLHPVRPSLWQFITYAFLHANVMHIFGNMFFLYIFGNNVNDKLGNVGYICFYLAGAVFSGLGHVALSSSPVLGASGAVAAVTGAYLVLFPQTLITVLYWFIFIGTIDIPAMYFIAFKLIIWDNILTANPQMGIAYGAHLAGYGFGIVCIIVLLAIGILERTHADLWSMIRQWNRRRQYRDTVSEGYDPYKGSALRKKVESSARDDESGTGTRNHQLRAKINSMISTQNIQGAASSYLELVESEPDAVLSRQNQLDVANQLMSEGKWQASANAYNKFLDHYRSYQYSEQVELMLGILYSRYLNDADKAVKHLEKARPRLSDQGQKKMCDEELSKLGKA